MKPEKEFLQMPKTFWAYVRLISESVGYTQRKAGHIKIPTVDEIEQCLRSLRLDISAVRASHGESTKLGTHLQNYFRYRADCLNAFVEPRLMEVREAKRTFDALKKKLKPKCPIPLNKQKGDKKRPAYLTSIVNMLVEANSQGFSCDYDPRQMTAVSRDGVPLRTLARRVDGAFPSVVNPIAIWEIKEYYYTTTFGSRVADGVYESLLDGMELEDLRNAEGIHVRHYLMLDARYTWWDCGKSYLCRIVDMLHMGYVDEVLFGKEVVSRLPELVTEWVRLARKERS